MSFRTSSTGRLSKLIGVSAKVLGQSVAGVISSRPLLQTRIAQAKALTEALAELKGASMKFGQMLSIQGEVFLPPEVTEILSKLQNSAPAFSGQEMFEIAKSELGSRLSDLEFDLAPIAAASIGQVHRIRLKSGEAGIMKIQYPGIDKAIGSEIALLKRALGAIARVYVGEIAVDLIVDEVKSLLLQEVDYRLEISYINKFRELLVADKNFIVPTPHAEYSTSKVISMSQEDGLTLKELNLKNPTQQVRNQLGFMLFDLYMREVYNFNLVQTDPNFGNYLFRLSAEPQIVLFDFGACKQYNHSMIESYKVFILSIRDQNKSKFFEISDQLGFLKLTESEETKSLFWEMCKLTLEPIEKPGPFDFGSTDLPKRLSQMSFKFLKTIPKTSPPKDVIFLNRKIGGIFNLMRSLNVKIDIRDVVDRYLQPN
jgi:predicted unusual protein kinase regulating ubiquinone biosynthesis (AarF/ABC1/UbiB family)